jgi:hypothetical protein
MADEAARNQILANMARADCDHDFGGEGCSPEDIASGTEIFNENLPVPAAEKRLDENGTLDSVYPNFRATYIDAAVGALPPLTTTNGNTYGTVVKVSLEAGGAPRPAGDIVGSMGINESIILIVDFNQSGFLSRLRKGPSTGLVWYYAYVPETENDPAGKSPSTDPVFKTEGGITLQYVFQTSTDTVMYPMKIPRDGNLTPFFFNHRLMLDPIETITCFGKSKKRSVALTITSSDGKLNHQILDSKKANSIESIKTEFLKKVVNVFSRSTPVVSDKFNAACAWAQKRSGDWLQVLACLDLQNRRLSVDGITRLPVFFVTHDRIAMAYALFMGVNVIFIKGAQKEIIVFRNGAAANPVQQQQSCRAAFETRRGVELNQKIRFLQEFARMRDTMLNSQKDIMLKSTRNKDELYRFMAACLHYVHTYFDIPNTNIILNGINTGDNCKKLTSLITAERLYAMHNGRADPSETFITNFERKDEFKSLDLWRQSTNGYVSRLIATLTGNNRKDMFAFLGYIQKLSDTVVDTFNGDNLGVKLYIKRRIEQLRGQDGFRDPPVAALLDNACVIIQVDTVPREVEPITTENFYDAITTDNGLSQAVVVAANIHNDKDDDNTNQSPNKKEPYSGVAVGGQRRRKTRRGGWDRRLGPWNYSIPGGSTVVFPIKQTTHLLLIAHLLADPPALCKMFGRCSIRSRPQFNDIRILDNDVQERGEVLTPRWLVSRFFNSGAPRAEELGPGGPVGAPAPAPAPEPEPEPEPEDFVQQTVRPVVIPRSRARRGSIDVNNIIEGPRVRRTTAQRGGSIDTEDHIFPIYVSLEALEPNIVKRLEGSLDMELYIRYYTFLEKLAQRTNALTEQRDKEIIAFALREVLFISSQHVNGQKAVIELLGKDDIEFLSIINILSNYICGEIQQYTPEFEKIIDELFKIPIVIDVVRGAYTDSGSFNPSMTVPELSNLVKKLRADLAGQITHVEAVKSVPEQVPLKIPQRQIEDVGDPTAIGARRRTRRLTKDFLQTTRHQSIKMSSRRHSLSGKLANR